MNNYFEKKFELGYFEMNKFGEASPTTILTLLEETAADHCYSIDYSLYDLQRQNIGWVLVSGILIMDRYPVYKEKITIRTWLSNYSLIKGFRENIIYDEKGDIIGKSRGLWVFFDIYKRRPTQIFDTIKERWSYCNDKCIDHDITNKIKAIDIAKNAFEFKINKFDLDTNLHVNNVRYLQWLVESVSEDITDEFYLHSIDGRFIAEANYGDPILSFSERNIIDNSIVHTIRTKKENIVCATAKTVWKKKI